MRWIAASIAILALVATAAAYVVGPFLNSTPVSSNVGTPQGEGRSPKTGSPATEPAWRVKLESREWKRGMPPQRLIHSDNGFAYLTGIRGGLNGRGENIKLFVNSDDGYWYLDGKTLSRTTWATAVVVETDTTSSVGRRLNTAESHYASWMAGIKRIRVHKWQQNGPLVKLIHRDQGMCFLTGIGGGFNGAEEIKLAVNPHDGNWYLLGRALNHSAWATTIVVETEATNGLRPELQEYHWSNGSKPIRMIHKDQGFCLLSGISGNFQGDGEKVRVYVADDGHWYLDGQSSQPNTHGWAISVRFTGQVTPQRKNPSQPTDNLASNGILSKGQSLVSKNGNFRLTMQTDGHLAVFAVAENKFLWSTPTQGRGVLLHHQGDGNLVVRNARGLPIWSTRTNSHTGTILHLQDDGNLVLYKGRRLLWASNRYLPQWRKKKRNETGRNKTN